VNWFTVWRRTRRWDKYWHRTGRVGRRLRKLRADFDAQEHIDDIDRLKVEFQDDALGKRYCARVTAPRILTPEDERALAELLGLHEWPRDRALVDTLRSHLP
jgi:hypothetical protein